MEITKEFLENRPLSYSRLKEFRRSPKHYMLSFEKVKVTSEPQIIGSAVDVLLISGEDEFDKNFMIYSSFEKRTKEAKAEWAALLEKARSLNKTLIDKESVEIAQKCVTSIRENEPAQPFLNMRRRHQKLLWKDKYTGLPCVGYTDWDCIVNDQLFIVDLKTSNSADPEDFTKAVWKYQYYIQVGSYLEGYKNMFYQFPYFLFLTVETVEPYNVSLNFVEGKYAEFCREEFLGTLKAFKQCLDKNLWHQGYEFRLLELAPYFPLRKPGYGSKMYGFPED